MNNRSSERAQTFDALFSNNPDPWGFQTSQYERDKRRATIAALGHPHYDRAVEIGCATGVLTSDLASLCSALLGVDVSQAALDIAARRLANMPHVRLGRMEVPHDRIRGRFDLVVLSEVLYFLSAPEVEETSRMLWQTINEGGECLIVNWTGANDLPLDGNDAVSIFETSAPWVVDLRSAQQCFRIDRLRR